MFINEDVIIGVWMLVMDVVYEDNCVICVIVCGFMLIVVWDFLKCFGMF